MQRLRGAIGPTALPKGLAAPKVASLSLPGAQFECAGSQGAQGPQGYQCGFQAPCFGSQGGQGAQIAPPDFDTPCFPGGGGSGGGSGTTVITRTCIGAEDDFIVYTGYIIVIAPTGGFTETVAIFVIQKTVSSSAEPAQFLTVDTTLETNAHIYTANLVSSSSAYLSYPARPVYVVTDTPVTLMASQGAYFDADNVYHPGFVVPATIKSLDFSGAFILTPGTDGGNPVGLGISLNGGSGPLSFLSGVGCGGGALSVTTVTVNFLEGLWQP